MNVETGIKKVGNKYYVRVKRKPKFDRKTGPFDRLCDARSARRVLLVEAKEKAELYSVRGEYWGEIVEAYLRHKKTIVAASTHYNIEKMLFAHTQDWWGIPLKTITRAEIRSKFNLCFIATPVATQKNVAKCIRGVFRYAVAERIIENDPMEKLGLWEGKKNTREKLKAMTAQEVAFLLQKAEECGHPWRQVWALVYYLGLRSGEAFALKWSDVNFFSGVVVIQRGYDWKSRSLVGWTKNGDIRTIPMNTRVREVLSKLRSGAADDFVLPRLPRWEHGEAARILREFQKQIGVTQSNFHSLRASFITDLLTKGVPHVVVRQLVGHKDLKTTDYYVRLSGQALIGATNCLDSIEPSSSYVSPFMSLPSRSEDIPQA